MSRRSAPLVSQQLENIARRAIQKYPEIIRRLAHGRHGIYGLYRKGRLIYVGKASDLWFCWKYERAPGDWIHLDKLRKR